VSAIQIRSPTCPSHHLHKWLVVLTLAILAPRVSGPHDRSGGRLTPVERGIFHQSGQSSVPIEPTFAMSSNGTMGAGLLGSLQGQIRLRSGALRGFSRGSIHSTPCYEPGTGA
jgi:hypothetical protein